MFLPVKDALSIELRLEHIPRKEKKREKKKTANIQAPNDKAARRPAPISRKYSEE